MPNRPDPSLGPLAPLAGVWEGAAGTDVAPSSARATAVSRFRERIVFEPIGRVDNHEQTLFGLRYRTTAWRLERISKLPEQDDGASEMQKT